MMAVLLCGCRQMAVTQEQSAVVESITAVGTFEGEDIQRQYIDAEKVRKVLLHIRALRPKHSAQPEEDGQSVSITLVYRDGSRRHCVLMAGRYWQEEQDGWKTVDSGAAQTLCGLLLELPGD